MDRERLEQVIWDAHKRAHGCHPDSENWNDPRWEDGNEWEFDASIVFDALLVALIYDMRRRND